MFSFDQYLYAPIHKWKMGEIQAQGTVRRDYSARILPTFIVPPTDEYDYDRLQRITLVEHQVKHL